MISTFGDADTERYFRTGKCKFSGLDTDLTDLRAAELDAATSLSDLSPLKSVGLHKLSGDLAEFWSLNLNGPWRLIFTFKAGHAYDVKIIDTHKKKKT